jgi:hypothetical protein
MSMNKTFEIESDEEIRSRCMRAIVLKNYYLSTFFTFNLMTDCSSLIVYFLFFIYFVGFTFITNLESKSVV